VRNKDDVGVYAAWICNAAPLPLQMEYKISGADVSIGYNLRRKSSLQLRSRPSMDLESMNGV